MAIRDFTIKSVALAAVCFCCSLTSNAQSVTGRVTDEHGAALEYVNVVLLSSTDSAFVAGAVSGEDGGFDIPVADDTHYILRLSLVGYDLQYVADVSAGNAGAIALTSSAVTLDEVTIKAQHPVVALKGNALVTSVAGTSLEHAGSANDVLPYVPMVLGRNGDFTVFGKGSPVIYVNNRKLQDLSELNQINSADIKNIELITNPGPKYDASVKSVIRIITKRPQGDGFSGTLRTQDGWHYDYLGTRNYADLKYRTGGLEAFLNLSYCNTCDEDNTINDCETRAASVITQHIDASGSTRYNNVWGKGGLSYMFNEHHSVGASYSNSMGKNLSRYTAISDITIDGEATDHAEETDREKENAYPSHYANVYYDGEIGKLGIDLNVDYMWTKSRTNATYDETSNSDGHTDFNTQNNSRKRLFAEKLVLSYPVWKGELEIGDEFTTSRIKSLYNTDFTLLNNSDSRTDERNIAGFAQLSQQFGAFEAAVGLRYEHVKYRYYDGGVLDTDQSRTYSNLFPSASLSYSTDDFQLGLSYSDKTQRPSYDDLDGNVEYVNRYTLMGGNPALQPETVHTLELTGVWQFLFAQLTYTHCKNPIFTDATNYDEASEVKIISYKNYSGIDKLNAFVGAELEIGIWQPKVNVGIAKQWLTVEYGEGTKTLNHPFVFLQMQNAIHIPGDIWLNADITWRSKGNYENVRVHHTTSLNAKIYKAFCNNHFSAWFEANDILNQTGQNNDFYCRDVTVNQRDYSNGRQFLLTLSYNFNTTNSRYRGQGAGNEERARF